MRIVILSTQTPHHTYFINRISRHFDICAIHSLNHNILSSFSTDLMRAEISESICELEKRLGYRVSHFSYPEGQKNHYNEEAIKYIKKMGILCCPSAIDGVNTLKDDPFHLKRISVFLKGRRFPFNSYYNRQKYR